MIRRHQSLTPDPEFEQWVCSKEILKFFNRPWRAWSCYAPDYLPIRLQRYKRREVQWGLYFEEGVTVTTVALTTGVGLILSIITGVIVSRKTDLSTGAGWGSFVAGLFALATGSGCIFSKS